MKMRKNVSYRIVSFRDQKYYRPTLTISTSCVHWSLSNLLLGVGLNLIQSQYPYGGSLQTDPRFANWIPFLA